MEKTGRCTAQLQVDDSYNKDYAINIVAFKVSKAYFNFGLVLIFRFVIKSFDYLSPWMTKLHQMAKPAILNLQT